MEELRKRNAKIFLALLIAGAITYCLFPTIKGASFQLVTHLFPERSLSVKVFSVGEGGGSEMWLSAPKGSPLLEKLEELSSNLEYENILGACEYRKAEEHGYACDFLVSYGDNVGSTFEISYVPMADSQLQIWCCLYGGIIEIRDGDKEPIYFDSYSQTGKLETIELRHTLLNRIYVWLITLFAWCICAFALYRLFSARWAFSHGAGANTIDDASIGLARTAAAFLVVYFHSFLTETGSVSYYHTPISGVLMSAATVLRWLAFCCVPLFMLLTGFLCAHRISFGDNVRRLFPMLSSFVIACVLHFVLRRFYWHLPISFQYVMSTIVGMDLAWYLEMYIGLVLLQPFLNILWLNLEQKQRGTFICVLLALTALGSITENLLPTWWVTLYPLTYYFIGAWLREYPVSIRRGYLLTALTVTLCLESLRSFCDAGGGVFPWVVIGGSINAYNAVLAVLNTVLLFLLLLEVRVRSHYLRQFFIKAGRHTLTTYLLLATVTESLFWTAVRPHFPTYQHFFPV